MTVSVSRSPRRSCPVRTPTWRRPCRRGATSCCRRWSTTRRPGCTGRSTSAERLTPEWSTSSGVCSRPRGPRRTRETARRKRRETARRTRGAGGELQSIPGAGLCDARPAAHNANVLLRRQPEVSAPGIVSCTDPRCAPRRYKNPPATGALGADPERFHALVRWFCNGHCRNACARGRDEEPARRALGRRVKTGSQTARCRSEGDWTRPPGRNCLAPSPGSGTQF